MKTIATIACFALVECVAGHVVGKRAASSTSSASSSAATPVKNSGKRGLAFSDASLTDFFSLSGQNSQVSWAYNWAASSSNVNTALEYVPMLWSNGAATPAGWNTTVENAIAAGSTHVLGFNEPDFCDSSWSSACMSVDVAVEAWQTFMDPWAGKIALGSPAVTNGGSPEGLTWLENFLDNCTGCTIDFINIHWYSNKYAGVTYLKEQIEAAQAIAGGRPIWITEFGLDSDDGSTFDEAELESFLKEAMAWMDEQDYVERYAYFMDAEGYLITADGTGLSDSGVLYNNYTTATTSSMESSTYISTPTSTWTSTALVAVVSPWSTIASTSTTSTFVQSSSTEIKAASTTPANTAQKTTPSISTSASSTSTSASSTSTSVSSIFPFTSATSTSASTTAVATTTSKTLTTSLAAPTSISLEIISAFVATTNVTTEAMEYLFAGSDLVINTANLTKSLHLSTDPWPGYTKTLSILFSYGGDVRVFTAMEGSGVFTIVPGSIVAGTGVTSVANYTRPSSSPVKIEAMVWGDMQITTLSVYSAVYEQAITNWGFQVNDGLFGVDPMFGYSKSAVFWYYNSANTLSALAATEDNWVIFE